MLRFGSTITRTLRLQSNIKSIVTNSARNLFIEVDPNQPNPDAIRVLPGNETVLGDSQFIHFENRDDAKLSPLAIRLFNIEGVTEISLGPDFITITRGGADHLWQVLKPDIFGTIEDFYASNLPVIADGASFTSTLDINDDDDETLAFIKTLLEERVRPTLFEDGGDLELISWEPITGILTLELMGACKSCPSSTATLKDGIANMMSYYVPEIVDVVQQKSEVEKVSEDEFNKFQAKLDSYDKSKDKNT